ncbi:MAG: thioredoxin domain-containing protein [Alphaproteobacteria bacterium]
MSFERNIKRISGFAAAFIIFFLASGTYLSLKGFEMSPDGKIALVNEAIAEPEAKTEAKAEKPLNVVINNEKQHVLGNPDAPVTIYEYSSFGCSHCAAFHVFTLPYIKKDFIDTGKVKLIFVDFPLDKRSMQASLLSYCIPANDYFDYLTLIFKKQREWSMGFNPEKNFIEYAGLFGVSKEKAQACLKNEDIQTEIMSKRQNAIKELNIQGTPAFLVTNGLQQELMQGAPEFEAMSEVINSMLKK